MPKKVVKHRKEMVHDLTTSRGGVISSLTLGMDLNDPRFVRLTVYSSFPNRTASIKVETKDLVALVDSLNNQEYPFPE